MGKLGKKEKGRYMVLAELGGYIGGTRKLPGRDPLPDLLDYAKTPITDQREKDIVAYTEKMIALTKKIRFQASLANWTRKQRASRKEKAE